MKLQLDSPRKGIRALDTRLGTKQDERGRQNPLNSQPIIIILIILTLILIILILRTILVFILKILILRIIRMIIILLTILKPSFNTPS